MLDLQKVTEIKQTKKTNYYFLWNVCVFQFKEHPSSLKQTTNVNGHTKMFLTLDFVM